LGIIQKQGIQNTVIVYIGIILGILNTIFVQPFLLTPDEVGLSRLLISISSLFAPVILLGASNTGMKFFPLFKNKSLNHHGFLGILFMILAAGILISGIILIVLKDWILSKYRDDSSLFVTYHYWAFPLAICISSSSILTAYCISLHKSIFSSFINDILLRILLIVLIYIYYLKLIDLSSYVSGIFIVFMIQLLILIGYIFIINEFKIKIDWTYLKKIGYKSIIRYTLIISVASFSSLALKFLDAVMLGAYLPIKTVGIYSIGVFIAQFIETPLNSLERSSVSHIAEAFKYDNLTKISLIYEKSIRYMLLLGGFLTVCVVCSIDDFLIILPNDFYSAGKISSILSVATLFNMATGVNNSIISTSKKYYISTIMLIIIIVISIILNMIFIPKFGIIGAAITSCISSIIFNLMKFLYIWKTYKLQPYSQKSIQIILLIIVAFFICSIVQIENYPVAAIITRTAITITLFYIYICFFRLLPEFDNYLLFGSNKNNTRK
jgi:O-antigen/teichoic acid export membrane protein